MSFATLNIALNKQLAKMVAMGRRLYVVNVEKEFIWNYYLDIAFPEGSNNHFRERREYDCNTCKSFVRQMGRVVAIDSEFNTVTIWDAEVADPIFKVVFEKMAEMVKAHAIHDLFLVNEKGFGKEKSYEQRQDHVHTWEHFHLEVPSYCYNKNISQINDNKNVQRTAQQVFNRGLSEITVDSLDSAIELAEANALLRATERLGEMKIFRDAIKKYKTFSGNTQKNFVWKSCENLGGSITSLRSSSLGTFLEDLSAGVELDIAVRKYEAMVGGANYKRPTPVYTQKQLDAAKKDLENDGLLPSLPRRFAQLEDITINNVLFSNKDAHRRLAGSSVFDDMATEVGINPKKFERSEQISIEKFVANVLPSTKKLEVLFENSHVGNLVSLIAPVNPDAPSMFKWDNAFGWACKNNVASAIKERVKSAGGAVNGVLRFSIQWNADGGNRNDLDAHCITPGGGHICYHAKHDSATMGELDVDIINPLINQAAVENITFPQLEKLREGDYKFYVNCFSHRGGRDGFQAEIEFNGQIFSLAHQGDIPNGNNIQVAVVNYSRQNGFTLKPKLQASEASVKPQQAWGLTTCQFIPVTVAMLSPNYWNEKNGIGLKHYFFMLKGCVNDENPNGFYNEFIKNEYTKHRKVLEALGKKMAVESVPEQLSGIGFNSDTRASLIVRAEGSIQRTLKVMI